MSMFWTKGFKNASLLSKLQRTWRSGLQSDALPWRTWLLILKVTNWTCCETMRSSGCIRPITLDHHYHWDVFATCVKAKIVENVWNDYTHFAKPRKGVSHFWIRYKLELGLCFRCPRAWNSRSSPLGSFSGSLMQLHAGLFEGSIITATLVCVVSSPPGLPRPWWKPC